MLQVSVAKNNEVPDVKINQQPVSWPDLKSRLVGIFKARAEKVTFVQGDDDVNFE